MGFVRIDSEDGYVRLFNENGQYWLQLFDTKKKDEWNYIYEMPFKKRHLKKLKEAIGKLLQ